MTGMSPAWITFEWAVVMPSAAASDKQKCSFSTKFGKLGGCGFENVCGRSHAAWDTPSSSDFRLVEGDLCLSTS